MNYHRHHQSIIVEELIGDRIDPNTETARAQWRKMYQTVTQDCWDNLDFHKGGIRVIHLYALRYKTGPDIEALIQNIYFFMVKENLDQTVRTMGLKMDVHQQIWETRTSAAVACSDHRIVDRYIEMCLNLRLSLWDLYTINILVYRHILLDMGGFPLIHFQRRLVNCQCNLCVGDWNLEQGVVAIDYSPFCNCVCPICQRL